MATHLSFELSGVTRDEPVTAQGDKTAPDAARGKEGNVVRLRAERNPRGDGRVYRVSFTVSDGAGGNCSGVASVAVPRRKNRPAVDSAPPAYNSLGS